MLFDRDTFSPSQVDVNRRHCDSNMGLRAAHNIGRLRGVQAVETAIIVIIHEMAQPRLRLW